MYCVLVCASVCLYRHSSKDKEHTNYRTEHNNNKRHFVRSYLELGLRERERDLKLLTQSHSAK